MGSSFQGVVLPGQVQAVKEGTGINIAADGTISVDEGDLTTFVRLNNGAAYNNYVWPNTSGANATFLMTDATGNLSWRRVRIPVNTATPTTPTVGEMWFDCATGQFKVYEACTTGTPQWTSVSQPGLPVLPANTTANPAFTGGSGTSAAPYACTVTTIPAGSNIFIVNKVTITGLAPNQYVPIVDLNAVTNGGRYSFTNNYADSLGNLTFQTVFKDQPASPAGTTYTANIKVGYGSVYISAQVGIVSVISITNPGTITGTPEIGQTLTYTTGTATGGTGTYTYTWQWFKDSDNSVLQTGGSTYLIPTTLVGEKIFVRLTATDTVPQSASANTDLFPANGVITKGSFPNPTPPAFPGEIGVDSCFTWDGPGTTLQSNGCVEFNINGGGFGQAAQAVATNDVVCTRWVDVASSGLCGDAPNGTTINGCLFDATHEACGSLTIDRVPSTFPPFATVTDHVASTVATSNGSTPFGYNATSYVTGSLSAGASTLEGSIDGGLTWAAIPASGETFGINPGETLFVRYTTGASSNTTYVATINLGQAPNYTTQTFTVVNDAVPFPSTTINFPTFIPDVTATTWNEAGTTSLTANGCIEMATAVGGPYSQSLSISNGNTLYTRWISSAACADKASGPITGCIFSAAYEQCDTLEVNRVPTNFPPIAAVTGVLPGAYATSAAVTPTGTTAPSYLTTTTVAGVSNVEASVDGGVTWTTVPTSGTTFEVPPHTSIEFRYRGASAGTTYTVPFKLGDGVSSITQNFVVTTGKPAFPNTNISFPAFIPQVTTTTWNEPGNTVLAPSGCIQISLDGTTWTNATETIASTATLYTRYNPSAACGGATSGTISGCVSSSSAEECGTLTINRTPSNFPPIAAVTGVTPGTYGTSAAVNPSGFTAPAYVTVASVPAGVTNIEASVDGGGTWFGVGTSVSASAVVNPDQNITFRFRGANPTTTYNVDFRLGDGTNYVQQTFSVTTGTTSIPTADWNPSPSTGPNASPDTVNSGSLKGIASGIWNGTVPQTLTATGALQINLNSGAWGSSVNATVSGTDVVGIRWNPATVATAIDGDVLTGTVTDGTNVNTYSFTVSKTVTAGSLAFTDLTNQSLSTTVTSASVTPTGFNVPISATFAGTATNGLSTPLLSAGGGAFSASPVTVDPGAALLLRGTTGGTVSTAYGINITLGGQTDTWTATTAAATPAIATPAISSPTNGATNVNPNSSSPAGITLQTTSAYSATGGAGLTQTSSEWEVYKDGPGSSFQSTATISAVNAAPTPSAGDAYGGGYYMGQYTDGSVTYDLVVAPVASGQYGGVTPAGIEYKNSATGDVPSGTFQNLVYGGGATTAGNDAAHPMFQWAEALVISGYSDWYIPAKNELNICYLNQASLPAGEGWPSGNFWSSSEYSSDVTQAWIHNVGGSGSQNFNTKTVNSYYARAVRRVPVTGSGSTQTLSIAGANTDGFTVGMSIKGSSSGATGIITAINGTSVTITQTSATNWTTSDKIEGNGTAISGSPFIDTTSPFTSQFIPASAFTTSTTYYARLRYRTSNPTATDSAWSAWVGFTTSSCAVAGGFRGDVYVVNNTGAVSGSFTPTTENFGATYAEAYSMVSGSGVLNSGAVSNTGGSITTGSVAPANAGNLYLMSYGLTLPYDKYFLLCDGSVTTGNNITYVPAGGAKVTAVFPMPYRYTLALLLDDGNITVVAGGGLSSAVGQPFAGTYYYSVGSSTPSFTPVTVSAGLRAEGIRQIVPYFSSAGLVIVLTNAGKIYAVGNDLYGSGDPAFGIPTTGTWSSPAQIGTSSNWKSLGTFASLGNRYGFSAVNTSGDLYAVGSYENTGNFHQIGSGFASPVWIPYTTTGLNGNVVLGVKTDGKYYYMSAGDLSGLATWSQVSGLPAGYNVSDIRDWPQFRFIPYWAGAFNSLIIPA